MPQYLPALTGIRALAALAVVMYHIVEEKDSLGAFGHLLANGYLGVDLFFILSGFIIQHVYRSTFSAGCSRIAYNTFILNRFARIWPVHIMTMAAMLGLYLVATQIFGRVPADAEAFSAGAILSSVFMIHAWIGYPSPNIPAWSISAEWFAYLVFPAACLMFWVLPHWTKLLVGLVALIAIQLFANYHPLLRIIPEFALGMVLRDIILINRPSAPWSGLIGCVALVTVIYSIDSELLGVKAALFGVIIVSLTNSTDWLAKVLATAPLVYLGEISYSTYMTHGVVWATVKNVVRVSSDLSISSPMVICIGIIISLIASVITYHVVELPSRHMLRLLSKARTSRKLQPE